MIIFKHNSNYYINLLFFLFMQRIILEELKESQTFTVDARGKRFGFSKSSSTINGKQTIVAQWKLNGQVVLEISTAIAGMWRILRDGRKGYVYEPTVPLDKQFIVLLIQ